MSVKELYDSADDFIFPRPRARGQRIIIEIETTVTGRNQVDAYVTLLDENGKQVPNTHARAWFGDSSAPTVSRHLDPLIQMVYDKSLLDDRNGDGEEEPEDDDETEQQWDEYDRMNLISLKEELRQRDLSTNGNKIQLIRRLRSDDERSASKR